MNHLTIDSDAIHDFQQRKIFWAGEILAKLEFSSGDRALYLETNGEEDSIYLEVVDYKISHDGTLLENGFSEPIYELQSSDEVEELFQNWISQD